MLWKLNKPKWNMDFKTHKVGRKDYQRLDRASHNEAGTAVFTLEMFRGYEFHSHPS